MRRSWIKVSRQGRFEQGRRDTMEGEKFFKEEFAILLMSPATVTALREVDVDSAALEHMAGLFS